MSHVAEPTQSRWRRPLYVALVLLGGALVPSPFERRESFRYVGPDKWLHFLGHGVFAAVLADAFGADGVGQGGASGLAIGGSASLGLLVGYLQQYVPGRAPELADFVAAVAGSLAGVGWWYRTEKND